MVMSFICVQDKNPFLNSTKRHSQEVTAQLLSLLVPSLVLRTLNNHYPVPNLIINTIIMSTILTIKTTTPIFDISTQRNVHLIQPQNLLAKTNQWSTTHPTETLKDNSLNMSSSSFSGFTQKMKEILNTLTIAPILFQLMFLIICQV